VASKAEIKRAIADARKSKNAADQALKKLTDIHVPKQARKARLNLIRHLRNLYKKLAKRIKVLRKRLEAKRRNGAAEAVKAAQREIGQREQPVGSNWGGHVTDYITWTGYNSPVFWCGCFACWCVTKHGKADIPQRIRMGYGPYIIADAKAGNNGFKAVPFSQAKPGDVLVYWGGEHIGLVEKSPNGSIIQTIEGNTGDGNAVNGDGVYRRTRTTSDVSIVARPDYS
jgi:hypothetical protein